MRPYSGYKAERKSAREILPAGGYVARIMDAKENVFEWGRKLEISFDICEGEYRDFFAADYRSNTNEDRKWRGVYRLTVPKDDGTEKDGWTKNTFNGAMWAIEESNPGFRWAWDETALKGKFVGVIFRNKEWEMNGNTGWTTECGMLNSADNIRCGKFKPLKDKPLKAKPAANAWSPAGALINIGFSEPDADLPF